MSSISCWILGVTASTRAPFWRSTGVPYLTTVRTICHSSLVTCPSNWPIPQHSGQILHTGALARADIEATGRDTHQEAAFGVEPEQLAQAEAGIEMIACAGCDLRLGGEGTLHHGRAVRTGRKCVGGRVNHKRLHANALMDFLAALQQAFRRAVCGAHPQDFGDLVTFLLVQAQDHIK